MSSANVSTDPTDPSTYSKRDLLLLTQLLHMNGLIEPSSVSPSEQKLEYVSREWFDHASTQLSIQQGSLNLEESPSVDDICQLYERLLSQTPDCKNTTDLANYFYYNRMDELQSKIDAGKKKVSDILQTQ
ncbi:DEHA2B08668p [Debaryomyces hansenii CBS767]|uniref:DEHA2B08668p n=1 Tax=Debaryomyces hansenii (strain ATCC 36239 / CBS 767 / BCRC 21394 / JCM 1990 / NBRC 0083 / IGC 2968) TaxID=284592 RepID=Q6BWT6_DEBHA|nr:DEHA2B08668p [Debaryomyces hansenii CBS767]CAG85337.2 DEHA2B08668p [Debaryomyces hansenii CBS767]|eukprot:XP_457333.2 DEHA2B08668p [Debaryomyces hansenii CBS767]